MHANQSTPSPLERAQAVVHTIDRIHTLRSAGHSVRRIAGILFREGHIGPRGGRWTRSAVWQTIRQSAEFQTTE